MSKNLESVCAPFPTTQLLLTWKPGHPIIQCPGGNGSVLACIDLLTKTPNENSVYFSLDLLWKWFY